jgi:pSer/pThr/pTyr-binding forkhead associated (FHA) protein
MSQEEGSLELTVFTASRVVRHRLPAEGRVTIGRAAECDVRIDDASVSRNHAILHVGPPLRIEDLGSANGTRIQTDREAVEIAKLVDTRLEKGKAVEVAVGDTMNLGSVLARWASCR